MANNQRFSITFDASLNVGQIKGALGDIQKGLNSLHLPQNATKGLQGTFSKLSEEIQKFEVAAGKEIGSKADFSKLEKSAAKIGDLFGTLKRQVSELTGLKGKALEKIFPENISRNITQASKSLNNYKTAFKNAQNDIDKATSSVEKFNKSLEREKGKKVVTSDAFKKIEQDSKQAQVDVDTLTQKLQTLQEQHKALGSSLTSPNRSSVYRKQTEDIKNLTAELEKAKQKATALSQQKANTTTFDKQAKKVAELTANLTDAQAKLTQFQQIFNQLQNPQGGDLSKLIEEVGRLTGLDMSKFKADAEGVGQAIETYIVQETQKMSQGLDKMGASVDNAGTHVQNLGKQMQDVGREIASADAKMREVDALKSRIQYFFGLNNTIELVKRTIRSAFETVKELDKAMTETAVVTDFSVADMWSQLPDYTKRANDLGVTTKAAYEAATLYYQQGLKTNEVTAMSNETLKMARIAGLDAAVATDRMTNAIRGFNMEINETNAQRIDDVYSKLAAISASNVDEISTAMTKVASLANSANMEFETTSAFLAQIIETTRESAETAGTALKTVVARFSEVKKLVSEDQLKGQDEEGQLIDVNKVSQALRTAGVDLNKYFLGEVGLDDIFMELASKWDSLTTLQQRYIATQAAGSRQQSRFIALMSDYGRMQELVGEAYSANGAAAEQFAKTQESLESKLARLKNAWNEFAMGIANSDLVKAGVDFLTLLLNGVNKLTDGFGLLTGSVGGFISSILKLGLLIGGLNLGKNLIGGGIGGIGSLLKGESFKGGFTNVINPKDGSIFKTLFGGFGQVGKSTLDIGKGLFNSIGNFGFKLSTGKGLIGKIASGAGVKGFNLATALGLGGDAAASIGGFSAALGTIAPIAIAATVAVKKLYDLSPTGQVKIAEKYAKNIGKIADEAKKTEASLKDAQTKYKEYNQAISNSVDIQGYSKAVQDRNEYLTSLLEQDASFAKYIQSEVKNGELVLSINEETFANAIAKAEENTQNLKVDNLLAQANLAAQKADLANANRIGAKDQDYNGNFIDTAKSLQYASQQQLLISESQAFAAQAAQEILTGLNVSDEIANSIATSYGKIFDSDKFQEDLSYSGISGAIASVFDNAVGLLDSKYEAYYGADSAKGLTRAEKVAGISAAEQRQGYEQELSDIAKVVTEDTSGQIERLFKAMSGDIDLSDEELESPKLETALEKLADVLGKTTDQTKTQIKQAQEQRKELRQAKATNIYSQALQSGKAIIPDYRDLIDTLDFDRITGISNILDSVKGKINEDLFSSLFDSLPEMGESAFAEFSDFFKSFNLDTPIQAFKQLQDAKEKALEGSEFSNILNNLEEVNAATFETSNLFKSFYQSDAYDSISDDLADLIEKNGKISGENIEELSASCSDLDTLLIDTSLTAEGLARALNSLSDGTLSIDSLTSSVLAAISAGQDYESLLNEIHKTIEDFDPGLDTGEGSDFIVEQAKNLNELIEGYEFGNEQTKNIYNALFGAGAYQQFMSDWGERGIDEFAAEAQNKIQQLSDWAENNSYGFMKQFAGDQYGLGITQTGDYDFEWDISQFESTDAVLLKIMETANVSKEAAEMLFSGFAAQSYDLQEAWNQLDYKTKLNAFAKDVQDKTFITKEELDALGKATGKTTEEVLQNLQKLGKEKGINIPVAVELKDKSGNDLTGGALKGAFKKAFRTDEKSFKDVARNYAKQFEVALADGSKGINADALFQNLTSQGFSPEQASELADNIVKTTEDQLLTKTIKIPKIEKGKDGAITVTSEDVVITADSMSGLTAAENAAMEAANYDMVAQKITEGDFSGITDSIKSAVETAVNESGGKLSSIASNFNGSSITSRIISSVNSGISQARAAFANAGFRANVALTFTGNASGSIVKKPHAFTGKTPSGNRNTWTPENAAAGGKVKSAAGGIRSIAPGISLTGEEDPEIVWNKEQGYAYITGKNGPEFQNLQPGDRVFNADETKRILKRSKENKTFPSFAGASGGYNPKVLGASVGSTSKTSSKASNTDSEKTSAEWKNELDWLYNLMEDISEYERQQTKLAETHERYLKDSTKTGQDLYEITQQELVNLREQQSLQKQALKLRKQEMQEQIMGSGYTKYVWWNDKDQTIEIDWDAIEGITDEETYKKVSELVSQAEDIQDKIDTATDALFDIEDKITDLEERYKEEFLDFQNEVLDAVVYQYQSVIDNLTELDDTLTKSNNAILNSIRDEIDLQRQIRDNTDTENEISDMEARLAYLRRDTTGANQTEILALEKQLEEKRQDYQDNLVDQAIDRLSEDNDKAAEQRQHQIDLLTDQLEYWKKNGDLWPEVERLIKEGMAPEGFLTYDSELYKLLYESQGVGAMSKEQQDNWKEKEQETAAMVGAYQAEQEKPLWRDDVDYSQKMKDLILQRGEQALQEPQYKEWYSTRIQKRIEKDGYTREQAEAETQKLQEQYLAEYRAGGKSSSSQVTWSNNVDYAAKMISKIASQGFKAFTDSEYQSWRNSRVKKRMERDGYSKEQAETDTYQIEYKALKDYGFIDEKVDYAAKMIEAIKNSGNNALSNGDYKNWRNARIWKRIGKYGFTKAQAENETKEIEQDALKKYAKSSALTKYATGGLNTKTGLAWLDGTPNEPEYVLNARQTEAFLRLTEILPNTLNNSSNNTRPISGDIYLELTMNVNEISSDYDVDRLVDRVKEDINEAAAYRNVNVISYSR